MKFSGKAGFRIDDVEIEPGVYEPKVVVKTIKGDVVSNRYQHQNSDKSTIDNVRITNQLLIVANQFFNEHIANLVYIEFQGVKWKVESFDIRPPRVVVSLGGVYNEQSTGNS